MKVAFMKMQFNGPDKKESRKVVATKIRFIWSVKTEQVLNCVW